MPFNGNLVTVALGLALFMLTSIGIGLLVSLVSRTQQQAQQTVMFILIPTMVLSGFIFPIESMPPAIVPLTYLIPLRYALVVLRGAFLKGASIAEMWQPLLAMAVFAAVIFGIAVCQLQQEALGVGEICSRGTGIRGSRPGRQAFARTALAAITPLALDCTRPRVMPAPSPMA